MMVAMVLLMELSMVLEMVPAMVENWEDGRCRYGHCVMLVVLSMVLEM